MQAEFAELQARLRALWPNVTLRSIGDVERTLVVVHSISFEVPDHLIPTFPAYEERFLCLVLSLLRAPRSRVIYVTSQPVLPRLIDYYFGLVPEIDTPDVRSRFIPIALCDGNNRPLSRKLLERPGAVTRVKNLIGDPISGCCCRSRPRRPRWSSPSNSGSRSSAPTRIRPGSARRRAAAACSSRKAYRTRAASRSTPGGISSWPAVNSTG
jgi:hypothetical protein